MLTGTFSCVIFANFAKNVVSCMKMVHTKPLYLDVYLFRVHLDYFDMFDNFTLACNKSAILGEPFLHRHGNSFVTGTFQWIRQQFLITTCQGCMYILFFSNTCVAFSSVRLFPFSDQAESQ